VALVFHRYELAPLAVKLVLPPSQRVAVPAILTVGVVLTVTVTCALFVQVPVTPHTV
jgi:hypothetical protein